MSLLAHSQEVASDERALTAKLDMSARKTVVLTTFSMEEPASVRTAWRFLMQRAVFSAMEASVINSP